MIIDALKCLRYLLCGHAIHQSRNCEVPTQTWVFSQTRGIHPRVPIEIPMWGLSLLKPRNPFYFLIRQLQASTILSSHMLHLGEYLAFAFESEAFLNNEEKLSKTREILNRDYMSRCFIKSKICTATHLGCFQIITSNISSAWLAISFKFAPGRWTFVPFSPWNTPPPAATRRSNSFLLSFWGVLQRRPTTWT